MSFFKKKYFSKVKLFGIPIGWFFSKLSRVADEDITLNGVLEAKKIVDEKKEGLFVFFAHLGLFDVFGTACALEKVMDYKAVFPVAASWYYFPIIKLLFKKMDPQTPHKFIPVFRKEELGYSSLDVKFVDFSGLNHEDKKLANKKYVEKSIDIVNDGGVVILAPYGGRAPRKEFLRSGPIRSMQEGKPIIFSLTVWSWKKMGYEVFFSDIYRFERGISKDNAHELITKEFFRMGKLVGINKSQILHAKSSSGITAKAWNLVSPIFNYLVKS